MSPLKRVNFFGLVAVIAFGLPAVLLSAQPPAPTIQELLRNPIESAGIPLKLSIGEEPIYAANALPAFHERRAYRPAWIKTGPGPMPLATSLLNAIQAASGEGLQPNDYHLDKIEHIFSEIRQTRKIFKQPNSRLLVDLDLVLTDAFLIYGSHLVAGRINPERIDPQWFVSRRETNMVQVLEETLTSAEIEKPLKSLLPLHAGYERLLQALAFHRTIAANNGWPSVSAGRQLKKGDQSDQISILRQRLAVEGFVERPPLVANPLFDNELEQALKKFQIQNGIEPDCVLGKQTIKALDITA